MNFKNWIKKNYSESDCPKGDLARDIIADEKFPKNGVCKFDGWRDYIRNYLVGRQACDGCLASFDEAWEEYEACERKRLKLPLVKK